MQVYIDNSTNAVNAAITGANAQVNGWVLEDWLADATTPSSVSNYSGFTEKCRIDLDNTRDGGMETTGQFHAQNFIQSSYDSSNYARFESNSSGGVIKALSSGNTNVLFRSYGDSYTLNDLGVGISTPAARLHVDHPTTTTPVLSFGGAAGQILQSENSEFAFGLTAASPYPLYIQGRNSGNTSRNINLQPIGGNIGITQASPSQRLHVGGNVMANRYYGATSTSYYLDPNQTGDSIRVIGDIVAYYSSDKRYKENIKPIESPIEKVKAISGVTFEWNEKSHKETGKKDVGVIAQEVEEVLPEIVQTRDNGYKAVDYQKLTAVLIEAVKDQQKQIDELKSIINGSS